jgi:hypothetical protein
LLAVARLRILDVEASVRWCAGDYDAAEELMSKAGSYTVLCVVTLTIAAAAVRGGRRGEAPGDIVPAVIRPPADQAAPISVRALSLISAPAAAVSSERYAPAAASIVGPARIAAGTDGHVFVIDEGSRERISEFTAAGVAIRTLERSGGMAIASVTDLAVDDETLWVTDLIGSAIHVVTRKTGAWKTLAMTREPYRAAPIGGGERLFVMRIGLAHLFDITDSAGVVIASADDLLANQKDASLALDGFLARSGGSFVFAGKYLGILASFARNGALNWSAEPIAAPDKPVVVGDGHKRWLEHGPLVASEAIASDESAIYVLARRIDGVQVAGFVDIYRAADGGYVQSLKLPAGETWRSVAVGGHRLFAAGDRGVYRWPLAVATAGAHTNLLSAGESIINFSRFKGAP